MSLQEMIFDLEPGGAEYQGTGESNYLFVDYADFPFTMEIDGGTVTLRKGSKFRYRGGMFSKLVLKNTSPDFANNLRLFVGTHEADNQIIEGEVSIVPILRNADGSTKTDTREVLQLSLNPYSLAINLYDAGDIIRQTSGLLDFGFSGQTTWLVPHPDGTLWHVYRGNNSDFNTFSWDPRTGLFLGEKGDYDLRFPPGSGDRAIFFNRVGQLFFVNAEGNCYRCDPQPDGVDYVFQVNLEREGSIFKLAAADFTNNELHALQTDGRVFVYDLDALTFKREFTIPVSAGGVGDIFYEPQRGELVLAQIGDNWRYVNTTTGELTQTVAANVSIYNSTPSQLYYGQGNIYYRGVMSGTTASLQKRALVDFQTKPEFFAVRPGCEFTAALRNFNPIQTTASFTVTETVEGVIVSGEVIKAALEFYFGRKMPDDYLDHVYLLDSSQAGFQPVSSGNETFARAAIADAFTVRTPCNLILRIDSELALGDLL